MFDLRRFLWKRTTFPCFDRQSWFALDWTRTTSQWGGHGEEEATSGEDMAEMKLTPMIENGKNPQKYIRYKAEDLDHMLGESFEGKTAGELRR
ncbi:hypothetical protein AAC387_Pa12g0862 [Persea americana]